MKVLAVEFVKAVKFPTGMNGHGRNYERLIIDHPESPHTQHTLTWDAETGELVVQHVGTGITAGVPRSNIAWTRPALGALARKLEAVKR